MSRLTPAFVQNFVFGVEDSLVSTVGLLSGVAAGGVAGPTIILTGIVLIFVEAFSMGVGSLLSDNSSQEFKEQGDVPLERSFWPGVVMFISYFISGFIPLLSYLFWPVNQALPWSIIFSLIALFILGMISGKFSQTKVLYQGAKVMVIGGLAVLLGVLVGYFVG